MITTRASSPESKENHNAIVRFQSLYKSLEALPHTGREINLCDLEKGVCFFSRVRLIPRSLPHDDTWTWNRSIPVLRRQVKLESGTGDVKVETSICKYNARANKICKRNPDNQQPKLGAKVWIFHAFCEESHEFLFSFYWCERGLWKQPVPEQAEIVTSDISPADDLDLERLPEYFEWTEI